MSNGVLAAAMVFGALALLLGFVSRGHAMAGVVLAFTAALFVTRLTALSAFAGIAFLSCWILICVLGIHVYWPRLASVGVTRTLSVVAGLVSGLVLSATGNAADLVISSLALLIAVPASVATGRGYDVALRIVMSWLLAVSVLAAILPFAVSNPGYVADHRG